MVMKKVHILPPGCHPQKKKKRVPPSHPRPIPVGQLQPLWTRLPQCAQVGGQDGRRGPYLCAALCPPVAPRPPHACADAAGAGAGTVPSATTTHQNKAALCRASQAHPQPPPHPVPPSVAFPLTGQGGRQGHTRTGHNLSDTPPPLPRPPATSISNPSSFIFPMASQRFPSTPKPPTPLGLTLPWGKNGIAQALQ